MIQQILVIVIGVGVFGYTLYKTYQIIKDKSTQQGGCGCKSCPSKPKK